MHTRGIRVTRSDDAVEVGKFNNVLEAEDGRSTCHRVERGFAVEQGEIVIVHLIHMVKLTCNRWTERLHAPEIESAFFELLRLLVSEDRVRDAGDDTGERHIVVNITTRKALRILTFLFASNLLPLVGQL